MGEKKENDHDSGRRRCCSEFVAAAFTWLNECGQLGGVAPADAGVSSSPHCQDSSLAREVPDVSCA